MYKDFAYIYDKLSFDIDYKSWYLYIDSLMKNKNYNKILDLGCGTGKISKYFLDKGKELVCLDISEDMLMVAQDRLKNNSNVKYIKSPMEDFYTNIKFDLIMSNCDSINYLNKISLQKLFNNIYLMLDEGASFIFDINSQYKLRNILGNNTYVYEFDDIFYTWDNFLNEENTQVKFFLDFFVMNIDSTYDRFTEEHIEYIYSEYEMINLLKTAGFKDIKTYESFSFLPVEENSERISFVVRK